MSILIRSSILAATIAASACFGAVAVDFNTPGDLDAFFTLNRATGVASENATAGFGGSRGVDFGTATQAHSIVFNQSFSGSFSSWESSLMVNTRSLVNSAPVSLGFATISNFDFSGFAPVQAGQPVNVGTIVPAIWVEFGTAGQTIRNAVTGVAPSAIDADARVLNLDTWYEISLEVDYLGSNQFEVTATTWTLDGSGSRVSAFSVSSGVATNAGLAADPDAFSFMKVNNLIGSIDNYRNTAIPEPSIFTCIAGSLALLGRRRRARN